MKTVGIVKPLKISAAVLRKNIRGSICGDHRPEPILSFPEMLHFRAAAEGGAGSVTVGVNVTLRRGAERIFRIAAYFNDLGFYSARRDIRRLGYLSGNLFKSYAALNQLTRALWSIYRSNDLRLRNSLLALIRTISEKSGTEFATRVRELSNLVHIRDKMETVLKSIDISVLRRFSAIGGINAVNTERRELYRRADIVSRESVKNVSDIFKLTESLYTVTPLLTRIYEGIETGVYLYDADSYRSAKTLQRLTNSLWKVYLGQNMELSRSFSRLITRVNLENKSIERRSAENNMFSDNLSLKNLVNALKRAFSGSNLELRSSMINLFGDIHNAGKRRHAAINKYSRSLSVGITLFYKEIVPERTGIRLDHKKYVRAGGTEQTSALDRLEREIKTKSERLERASPSAPNAGGAEDIVREVLERINKKQRLDWRLEKLQRGIF